jgi:hypothetical protein
MTLLNSQALGSISVASCDWQGLLYFFEAPPPPPRTHGFTVRERVSCSDCLSTTVVFRDINQQQLPYGLSASSLPNAVCTYPTI